MKRSIFLHVVVLCGLLLPALPDTPAQAQGTIYVDWLAAGANNGTSWTDAFTGLQDALDKAGIDDEIWVAAGTYAPTVPTNPLDPRTATFLLKSGVQVYGGFAGTETALEQRDWEENETILTGDIGEEGNHTDNSCHVITGTGPGAGAVLDGFTITDGNSDGPIAEACAYRCGGGMYDDSSGLTLRNITFVDNSALAHGGGMASYASVRPPDQRPSTAGSH